MLDLIVFATRVLPSCPRPGTDMPCVLDPPQSPPRLPQGTLSPSHVPRRSSPGMEQRSHRRLWPGRRTCTEPAKEREAESISEGARGIRDQPGHGYRQNKARVRSEMKNVRRLEEEAETRTHGKEMGFDAKRWEKPLLSSMKKWYGRPACQRRRGWAASPQTV